MSRYWLRATVQFHAFTLTPTSALSADNCIHHLSSTGTPPPATPCKKGPCTALHCSALDLGLSTQGLAAVDLLQSECCTREVP